MDKLLSPVRDMLEGQIDFTGQKQVELISTILLTMTGIIAFFVGLFQQNIHATVATGLAGTLITFVVAVPPWPFYNKNPEKWLPANTGGVEIEVDGKKVR